MTINRFDWIILGSVVIGGLCGIFADNLIEAIISAVLFGLLFMALVHIFSDKMTINRSDWITLGSVAIGGLCGIFTDNLIEAIISSVLFGLLFMVLVHIFFSDKKSN